MLYIQCTNNVYTKLLINDETKMTRSWVRYSNFFIIKFDILFYKIEPSHPLVIFHLTDVTGVSLLGCSQKCELPWL